MKRLSFFALLLSSLVFSRPSVADPKPQLCAAIQGNGDAIFAHFHSLARIISYYGLIDAAAGSSSGSITMFLYESMLLNPAIKDCTTCNREEKAQRVSLMLKSLVGFFDQSPGRREGMALYDFLTRLQEIHKNGIWNRAERNAPEELTEADFRHFASILGALYNPRFEQVFKQSPDKRFHYRDYKMALNLGAWKIDSPLVFLRPFPVTFEGIATIVGWIGNFYAGRNYTNQAHWNEFFETCQPDTLKEKTWGQIAYSNYDPNDFKGFITKGVRKATDCQKKFSVLMTDYLLQPKTPHRNDRVNERVGNHLATYPITGLIIGDGVKKIQSAKKAYWNAQKNIQINFDYEKEFRVGYFGTKRQLKLLKKNVDAEKAKGALDIKTSKFYPLPRFTWRDVFHTSPAEPSISEAIELVPDKIVSVSGWADPFPATILKMAECENTFFITAERKSFQLVNEVNALLGGGKSGYVESALARGLKDSDAVWCTNWNEFSDYMKPENVYGLTESSFRAGFESKSPYFLHRQFAKPATAKRYGCNELD